MVKQQLDYTQGYLTDEIITEVTLDSLQKDESKVTEYPILEFDETAIKLLCTGVAETLKSSKIKSGGGKLYRFIKRLADIIISVLALIILLIPMLIVALVIYIDDKGNPIFSQIRLTENGKPFRMYKFRSMCVNAEEKFSEVQKQNQTDGLAFKSENDPRITKIGKFIRATSIDELPQLWNVLKGDMSIIGPRPSLPREVVLYTPHQMNRFLVKGGLSCICQCNGRSDMKFDDWIESDIYYVKNRGLLMDFKLFFKTIKVVIMRKGAR
jgi:lipopolysaccharide/colanic/teichoic acid biosynthesis glycosyltransferase